MEIRDFFVSYNNLNDVARAEWIAKALKSHGYTVYFQKDDCIPGMSFPRWMKDAIQHSRGFIAVWSGAYEQSKYCQDELNAAYVKAHEDEKYQLLPVRVSEVPIENALFKGIVHTDLLSLYESENRAALLRAVGYDATNCALKVIDEAKNQVPGIKEMNREIREEFATRATSIYRKQEGVVPKVSKPDYIRLFLMTPFVDSYNPVVEAMRLTFEQRPFWFEVSTAKRDFKPATLVKNVQAHIASAHGFLAEVSEQRPNVMMEVGHVILSGDPRPIFAIKDKNSPKVPTDFGDLLTFFYDRETSVEKIAEEIRGQIVEDGDIINVELKKLCAARTCRYLSRTLLQELTKIPLEDGLIRKILARYSTVEAFVDADATALAKIKADNEAIYLLMMVQSRLKKQLQEDGYGR